jgi:uncharacterized protein YbjT (DUF2867 family)
MSGILLAGASGFIGEKLIRLLEQAPSRPKLMSVGRRPLPFLKPKSRVQEHIANFNSLEGWMTTWQAETAVCCLGTTIKTAGSQAAFRAVDYDAVIAFARLAKRVGVQHFIVVSAVGASTSSASFYSRVKGEMEAALQAMNFATLSIVQPSLLLGERAEQRLGERIGQVVSMPLAPLLMGPLSSYRPIHGADVAKAMATLALGPMPKYGVERLHYNDLMALN